MPSPRWLARLTVPMMVGAALVTGSAIATADPVNDGYLTQLQGLGFTWPPGHEEALIGMAQLICDDLGSGWTHDQIAQTSTPTWTAGTFITDKSQPWCTSHTRPIAPTSECWVAPAVGASWC